MNEETKGKDGGGPLDGVTDQVGQVTDQAGEVVGQAPEVAGGAAKQAQDTVGGLTGGLTGGGGGDEEEEGGQKGEGEDQGSGGQ
jgi:hypothetical protein